MYLVVEDRRELYIIPYGEVHVLSWTYISSSSHLYISVNNNYFALLKNF